MDKNSLLHIRKQAAIWSRELLKRDPDTWVILDTETTGLGSDAQVIQIGVIDGKGNVLIDNILVKPTMPIAPDATAIHQITNEMVQDAPSFPNVLPQLCEVVEGKLLVIYNAQYDMRLLVQSGKAHDIGIQLGIEGFTCAMLQYAEWFGDWNDYHKSFRWQKLQAVITPLSAIATRHWRSSERWLKALSSKLWEGYLALPSF